MTKDLGNSGASPAAVIRLASERDIPTITAIYGHHVRHGLASFEEIAPGEKGAEDGPVLGLPSAR